MFNERKAAQVAAWFLRRSGRRMAHLKLMKLMYLADREALNEFGFPITALTVTYTPLTNTRGSLTSVSGDEVLVGGAIAVRGRDIVAVGSADVLKQQLHGQSIVRVIVFGRTTVSARKSISNCADDSSSAPREPP